VGTVARWALALALCAGCSSHVGSLVDGGSPNIGPDGGADAGVDAGTPDAGVDAGTPDAGSDAGTPDAGPPDGGGYPFGTVGPWPTGNTTYAGADGIQEGPVVGFSTDESQNLWAATPAALYVMRPGETKFHRFDAAAGLHLPGHDEASCDDVNGNPITPCPNS
jgi:hypothetical protein